VRPTELSEALVVRLKGKELEYFKSRMAEWHLNKTEATHRLISDHERLTEDNKKQAHDLDVLKDLINSRPVASEADKRHQRQGENLMENCLRKLRACDTDTVTYLCWNCKQKYRKDFDACQQLSGHASL
jgi:hypothetical protein